MFLGFGEIVVVLAVALMVLGPKKMPEVARKLAKLLGQARRLTDEVRSQVDDALRETAPKEDGHKHNEPRPLPRLTDAPDASGGHQPKPDHEPDAVYDALGHKCANYPASSKAEAGPADD